MFIGAYLEEKHKHPQREPQYSDVWAKLYNKKKLIIIHHILLPIFGFPAVTVRLNTRFKNLLMGINPFVPELPVTTCVDPHPFYRLWCRQF